MVIMFGYILKLHLFKFITTSTFDFSQQDYEFLESSNNKV